MGFTTILLLMAIGDVNPSQLAPLGLDHSPLLKGFIAARADPHAFPPIEDKPIDAVAAVNCRFFRGPTELRWTAILFPTLQARDRWERNYTASSQAPVVFDMVGKFQPREMIKGIYPLDYERALHRLPTGHHEIEDVWKIAPIHRLSVNLATHANRVVIVLWLAQHRERMDHNRKLQLEALPEDKVDGLMKGIASELAQRASALPDNREIH